MSNGSGDYALAFSTAEGVRRTPLRRRGVATVEDLANEGMSPLFQATIEATEEAIYNSLVQATDLSGHRGSVKALPIDAVRSLLNPATQQYMPDR
jgi:D-aminopeptidase